MRLVERLLVSLFLLHTDSASCHAEKGDQNQEERAAKPGKLFFGNNQKSGFYSVGSTDTPFPGGVRAKPNQPTGSPFPPSSPRGGDGSVLLARPAALRPSPQLATEEFIASIESQAVESLLILETETQEQELSLEEREKITRDEEAFKNAEEAVRIEAVRIKEAKRLEEARIEEYRKQEEARRQKVRQEEAKREEEVRKEEEARKEDEEARKEDEEARRRYAEARRLLANPAQARLADAAPSTPPSTITATTSGAAVSTTEASVEEITLQYKPVKVAQRVRLLPIQSTRQQHQPTTTQPLTTTQPTTAQPSVTQASTKRPPLPLTQPPPTAVEEEFIWPTTYRPVEAVPGRSIKKSAKPLPLTSQPATPTVVIKQNVPNAPSLASGVASNFFARPDPPNAVRIGGPTSQQPHGSLVPDRPSAASRTSVRVEDIEVPRNSKMTKNMGLKILQDSSSAVVIPIRKNSVKVDEPAEEAQVYLVAESGPAVAAASTYSESVTAASSERKSASAASTERGSASAASSSASAVQGFRIKGDPSNRIVFLSLTDLGMEHPHARTLRIGGSELIPVDGLVSSIEGLPNTFLTPSSYNPAVEEDILRSNSLPSSSYSSKADDILHIQPLAAVAAADEESVVEPPSQDEPIARPSVPRVFNRFFAGTPAGAAPVVRQPAGGPIDQPAFVQVDTVSVPRHSKMVKNAGLQLLDSRRQAGKPGALPSRPTGPRLLRPEPPAAKSTSQQQASAAEKSKTAAGVVQGFRVVGDTTNRIIFLNLADLGLSPGAASLRLGNQELVPIDGLSSSSSSIFSAESSRIATSVDSAGPPALPRDQAISGSADRISGFADVLDRSRGPRLFQPQPSSPQIVRDALHKMTTTHQQGRETSAELFVEQSSNSRSFFDLSSSGRSFSEPSRGRSVEPSSSIGLNDPSSKSFVDFGSSRSSLEPSGGRSSSEPSKSYEANSERSLSDTTNRNFIEVGSSRSSVESSSGRSSGGLQPSRAQQPAVSKGPFVFFEKKQSADELRSLKVEKAAKAAASDRRSPSTRGESANGRPTVESVNGQVEFSQFPVTSTDPLETLRRLSSDRRRPHNVDLASKPVQGSDSRSSVLAVESRQIFSSDELTNTRVPVLPLRQDTLPKVPGVEAVLEQEAELRRIQQQFREEELKSGQPPRRLAPWEIADQQRTQQDEQPFRKEQPVAEQTLASWQIAEQRRLQQEALALRGAERQLAPWEVAEQRRIQEELSALRSPAPWELEEQRRQAAESRFEEQDFDFILVPENQQVQQEAALPKVPGIETVLQQEAALRNIQQQAAQEQRTAGFGLENPPGPLNIPGLEQHNRYVAELQAAQQSLSQLV